MIRLDVDAFLLDRLSSNRSPNTIAFYQQELGILANFCHASGVTNITGITPRHIRAWMVSLATHRSPGGVHAWLRAVRAFLRWYADEDAPPEWLNPMRNIKLPRVKSDPLPGITLETFERLAATCGGKSYYDIRNKAIFLFLLDTGVRVSELCAIRVTDVNFSTGAVIIQHGKGNKTRTVYMGITTRRALNKYLHVHQGINLFTQKDGRPLRRDGIESIIDAAALKADIPAPSPHDFRRAFALNMLRAGVDVFTLQRLMGHSDIGILRRYLALTDQDGRNAPSVVDRI